MRPVKKFDYIFFVDVTYGGARYTTLATMIIIDKLGGRVIRKSKAIC